MKHSEAKLGRVFVIRLEDGDIVHECLERFAREQRIRAAAVILVGGADAGSRLVVGPEQARAHPIVPVELALDGVHEVAGVGTIFPDARGEPLLHLHLAAGRGDQTRTGCVRQGVKVWHIGEVILWELTGTAAARRRDPATGFDLLEP